MWFRIEHLLHVDVVLLAGNDAVHVHACGGGEDGDFNDDVWTSPADSSNADNLHSLIVRNVKCG